MYCDYSEKRNGNPWSVYHIWVQFIMIMIIVMTPTAKAIMMANASFTANANVQGHPMSQINQKL